MAASFADEEQAGMTTDEMLPVASSTPPQVRRAPTVAVVTLLLGTLLAGLAFGTHVVPGLSSPAKKTSIADVEGRVTLAHAADNQEECKPFMEKHGKDTFDALLFHMDWWRIHGCQNAYHPERHSVAITRSDPMFQKCLGYGAHAPEDLSDDDCHNIAKNFGIAHIQDFPSLVHHVNWWNTNSCSFPGHPDGSSALAMYNDIHFLECLNHFNGAPSADDYVDV